MRIRALRNSLMFALAAIAASIEAPRMADRSLSSAAADITDASGAVSNAVANVASNVRAGHLGFDTNVYPGDGAMDAWRQAAEYEWVGYYLKGACHSDGSWSGKRERLTNKGWGLAVIYVGQQTWGRNFNTVTTKKVVTVKSKHSKHGKRVTRTMTRKSTVPVANTNDGCSASYVNATQGAIDAHDAVAKTVREGFPRGTTVFLDVEYTQSLPQRMRDYYRAWARTVLLDGRFRPGIYAHTRNAAAIYDDVSDLYAAAGAPGDPPFWIAGSSGFSPEKAPSDVGHTFATAWQGMLDVVREHNGVRLPIDISVASVASPSAVQ